MDRLSVESAVSIDGISGRTFEWENDDKTLKIIPDRALNAWTLYKWNIKDSAKSKDGVPLPKAYSAQFTTDLDKILPLVENIYPVLSADGQWFPTGANIENGLGSGQGIAVDFNKPMGENVLRSVRFEPSLTGRIEYLCEKSIVYIFTRSPEPETAYTIIISGDTRDSEGLKLGDEFKLNFTPDIPILNVLSFSADGSSVVLKVFSDYSVITAPVDPATGEIIFNMHFSLPFGEIEKQNAALNISLSAYFPRTIAPAALTKASWLSDDRLHMSWEGLEAGTSEESHYYKLTIPGGRGGISSGKDIYMKEDITIFLEAVNE